MEGRVLNSARGGSLGRLYRGREEIGQCVYLPASRATRSIFEILGQQRGGWRGRASGSLVLSMAHGVECYLGNTVTFMVVGTSRLEVARMARSSKHPARSAARQKKEYVVERIQTGVRMEKRLVKVLKAIAEYHDISLGDLLEGIVLHAFEGKSPLSKESQKRIGDIKRIYNLHLDAKASHRLTERAPQR